MLPATFNVRLDGDSIVSGPLVVPVRDPTEPILVAITRAYTAAYGTPTHGAFKFGIIRWSPPDGSDEELMLSLDLKTSAKRFHKAFGLLVAAEPPVLSLQVDGIGGDGDIASVFGIVGKVFTFAKSVLSITDSLRYREHRREIEDWEDSGSITMRLRQLVLAQSMWAPKAFSRIFRIRGRDRANLLSALGYEIRKRDGRKTWIETEPL